MVPWGSACPFPSSLPLPPALTRLAPLAVVFSSKTSGSQAARDDWCNSSPVIQLQESVSLQYGCLLDGCLARPEYVGSPSRRPCWNKEPWCISLLIKLTPGHTYVGPLEGDESPCICDTVTWSLFAACATCQNKIPQFASRRSLDGVNNHTTFRVRILLGIQHVLREPGGRLASFPYDIPQKPPFLIGRTCMLECVRSDPCVVMAPEGETTCRTPLQQSWT